MDKEKVKEIFRKASVEFKKTKMYQDTKDIQREFTYKDFKVKNTGRACPEQYDVYLKEKKVGHLRARYGEMEVYYIDDFHILHMVFSDGIIGYEYFDPSERQGMLEKGLSALKDFVEELYG